MLREARENIVSLREEVDKLSQPPSAYGVVVGKNDDRTVDVLTSGRKLKVNLNPEIDFELLERGAEVVLNESFNVVTSRRSEGSGDVVSIRELLADGIRAIVLGRNDEESVCELADALRECTCAMEIPCDAIFAPTCYWRSFQDLKLRIFFLRKSPM